MKIAFFVEAIRSIGHTTRCIEIAKSLKKINENLEFLFIVNSSFLDPFKKNGFKFFNVNLPDLGSKGGSLLVDYTNHMKLFLLQEKPNIFVFDTFFPNDMNKNIIYKKIKKVLILRKYRESHLQIFFDKKYFDYFDLILVPHPKEEFKRYGQHTGQTDKFQFVDPIIKDFDGFITRKINRKDHYKILVLCGGGGYEDSEKFVRTNIEIYDAIKSKIKSLEFKIITGPLYKNFKILEKHNKGSLKIINHSDSVPQLMLESDLIISEAGYNTINEIILSKKPAVLIPGYRNNDDQMERALGLEKLGVAKVVKEYNAKEAVKQLLEIYNNYETFKKNFNKLRLRRGNEEAAEKIIELGKIKSNRLKVGNKCNNNCVYCDLLNIKAKEERSLVEIKNEILELKNKGYDGIILPCNSDIRKDFFEILNYLDEKGFYIQLDTNGRVFYYKDFCEKIHGYINQFNIFLNSDDESKITLIDNSFKQTIQGIKNLKSINNDIQINTVITNHNYKNLKVIIEFIIKTDIKKWRPIFPIIKEENKHIPEIIDCFQIIDKAIKFAKDNGLNVITGELFHNPFIPDDLNLDFSNAELRYEYKAIHMVRIDASSVCQLKCPLCPTGLGVNEKNVIGKGYLKFGDFKKFVDDNPQINQIELSNWGEIFLNPDLNKIIKYSYNHNITLTAGNGVNLNNVNQELLEDIVKYKFKFILVSLDGANNETYKIYRKGGNFDKVVENIRKINYYKKRYNSEYPILRWQFIIFGHNEHELPVAKKMAKELNMEFVTKSNWDDSYSKIKNKDLIKKEIGDIGISREKDIESGYYKPPCIQFYNSPQINWDGKLLGCCRNLSIDFENVFKNGFEKCIENEKYQYTKNMLLGQVKPRDGVPCTHCNIYKNNYSKNDFNLNSLNEIKVSIIIPTYNRKDLLEVTLTSLFYQNYPKENYEIIVVDDGSSDGTLDMVKKLKPTCNLKHIYWPRNKPYKFGEPRNRVGPARNLGVKQAKGEILLFIDSDVIAQPDLLSEHINTHKNGKKLVIGARKNLSRENFSKSTVISKISQNKFDRLKFNFDSDDRMENIYKQCNYDLSKLEQPWFGFISNNTSVRKKDFELINGFDNNFVFWGVEDQEFAYRSYKKVFEVFLNTDAIGYHQWHEKEFIDLKEREKILNKHGIILYKKHLCIDVLNAVNKYFYNNNLIK